MNEEIERIRLRCVCGEDGCWKWSGATTRAGLPVLFVRNPKRTGISARRFIYETITGKKLGHREVVVATCDEPLCLNPDHMKRSTRSLVNKETANRVDGKAMRVAASRKRWDGHRKIELSDAGLIRASDKPSDELAAEYGCTVSYINYIRRGVALKDYSNPFRGLM